MTSKSKLGGGIKGAGSVAGPNEFAMKLGMKDQGIRDGDG